MSESPRLQKSPRLPRPPVPPKSKCLYCFSEDRDVILYPCEHSYLCRSCSIHFRVSGFECLFCDAKIESVLEKINDV